MKKHYQSESYPFGDCYRTCLASILEAENIQCIPNFMKDGENKFIENRDNWLRGNNINSITVDYDSLNGFCTSLLEKSYIIATGSNKGVFHSVVGTYELINDKHEIELIHDPIKDGNYFNKNDNRMGIHQITIFFGNSKFNVII